jgi:pimeloyl-ACP methyl ester carboxylesterase/predicted DCC family thiol-disulfide oxidoreductase YuxK
MSPIPSNPSLSPETFTARDGRSVAGERGRFVVPMRRAAPAGPPLELAFVRLTGRARELGGTPVVFLTGGPGLPGIASARGRLFNLFHRLRTVDDVILLDQRGSGESTPSLACADPLRVPMDEAIDPDAFMASAIDAMRACAAQRAATGIDLAAFNAAESADDVADLVTALGYQRAHLLGWSYGSHLAMAVMRRHPDRVARTVLAGPEGPDHTHKFPARVHAQLDRVGERAGFDAVAAVTAALARLDGRRVELTDEDGATVRVGRFDLAWVLAQSLADTRALTRLPAVLSRMVADDFSDLVRDPLLYGLLRELRGGLFNSPLRYCVDCASGKTDARWQQIQREAGEFPLGRILDWPFPEICAAFDALDLGDGFRAPLQTSLPVMFVTGTLDCRTPNENAIDLAPGFVNPRHLTVENAGHAELLAPPGVHEAIAGFLLSGNLENAHVTTAAPSFEPPHATLIYDGNCRFCRGRAEALARRAAPARVERVAYQQLGARFPEIDRTALARAVHVVMPDGSVSSGAQAVLRVAGLRSRGARLLLAACRRVPGLAPLAESLYRVVARNRHRFPA